MARVTLNLPADLKTKAEARAAESGHASIEDYIQSLVEADATAPDDIGGPPHLSVQSDEELESLLLQRVDDSRAIEATPEFWQKFQREIDAKRRPNGSEST